MLAQVVCTPFVLVGLNFLVKIHNLVECVRFERLFNIPNVACYHYTTHSLWTLWDSNPPDKFLIANQATTPSSPKALNRKDRIRTYTLWRPRPAVYQIDLLPVKILNFSGTSGT